MTVNVMFDAQFGGNRVAISTWRFSNVAPYINRGFDDHDPNKSYLFKCKMKGCGSTEFESMHGGVAQCDHCEAEYVFGWDNG